MYLRGIRKALSFSTVAAFFVLVISLSAWGQIVGYDTSTQPGGANNFGASPLAPSVVAANVTATGLTRGAGVLTTGTGAARGFGGTGFNTADAAASIAADKFFTFTVKANTGFTLSLSSINPFDYRRSGTGPPSALIQYSINGGSFVDITTVSLSVTAATGGSVGPIDLSGIAALQNLPATSTVTFRIVPFGASASGGTFYIFDVAVSTAPDLAVNGTVAPVTPTAADAYISGQVTMAGGRGIQKVRVMISGGDLEEPLYTLTNAFGYYKFENLSVGETYILEVTSRRYSFANPTLVVNLQDNVSGTNFIGQLIQDGAK